MTDTVDTAPPSAPRWLEYQPLDSLIPDPRNPKGHSIGELRASMGRFGYTEPVVVDERTGMLVAGHGRRELLVADSDDGAAPPEGVVVADDGTWMVPVNRGWASRDDDEAQAYLVASNQLVIYGGWNLTPLAAILTGLRDRDGLSGTGFDTAGVDDILAQLGPLPDGAGKGGGADGSGPSPTLADRFLVPPFSVLDARQGYWQERKRQWLATGLRSEEGRPTNLLKMSDAVLDAQRPNRSQPGGINADTMKEVRHRDGDHQGENRRKGYASGSGRAGADLSSSGSADFYTQKRRQQAGRELTTEEFIRDYYEGPDAYIGGTSIFDPVLCEIAYRWWCPPGSAILDPFAGGSVRGIVAAALGHNYVGVDLRPEQCDANRDQMAERTTPGAAVWIPGDSRVALPPGPFDFIFSCPPYFDLEQYSDDPDDISKAASYEAFLDAYAQIIREACDRLDNNRFACFVVGEVRDHKTGNYRGLIPDTIRLFEAAGLRFYNEAILVTAVGSLALRGARIFSGGRKLGKAHQNVLVFVKGDARKAAEACGTIEIVDPAEMFGIVVEPDEAGAQPESPAGDKAVVGTDTAGPAWAKGYDIGRLKEASALFSAHDGPLPLGAFSRVKDTDIAAWAEAGTLRVLAHDGRPVLAANVKLVTQRQPVRDFRDETIGTMEPGDLSVSRVAVAPGFEHLAAERLRDDMADHRLWLQIWQEHPVDRWLAAHLGLAWQGTKVKASSELVGVWAAGLEPATLGPLDFYGIVPLAADYDPAALLSEVEEAAPAWADHYAVYNQRNTWQAVALQAYGGDPGFIIKPSEMSKKWKGENPEKLLWEPSRTPLADQLPLCWAAAESLGRCHRVRLMRLAPGDGELSRHADITDPDAGTADGRLMRVHLPLRTNPEVMFRMWLPDGSQQAVHMAAGQGWSLDTRKPHTARNGGAEERIHLVCDVEATETLRARALPAVGDVQPPETAEPEAAAPGTVEPWQV